MISSSSCYCIRISFLECLGIEYCVVEYFCWQLTIHFIWHIKENEVTKDRYRIFLCATYKSETDLL